MEKTTNFEKLLSDIFSDIEAMQKKLPTECIMAKVKIQTFGGSFVKFDGVDIFFDIPKGSKADDTPFLREQRDEFKKHGITLKIKIIAPPQ